jgi:ribosomal protein S18 acetylase RimI-like enzyme
MPYEIESAIENRQVLAARREGVLAGLLFFETQGLASTVRFWTVAEKFRDCRVGSALIQHYFQTHGAVRRFTLWVNSNNENAISKYRHYGYAPDGLVDQVLANEMIIA